MKIAIIGAGAAGCFAAIHLKRYMPEADITVYEAGKKALAKVAVTGGGRCNLTNSFRQVRSLDSVYPRGARLMKRLLREFSHEDAYQWFEDEGVRLTTQSDECVFPISQDAMEIVHTLLRLMKQLKVRLALQYRMDALKQTEQGFELHFSNQEKRMAEQVLVTVGGIPRLSGLRMFQDIGLPIADPIPSLFSFCIDNQDLKQLMGTVVEPVGVALTGTKLKATGALLITHWGVSGPAVLKLSSYAARLLADSDYHATLSINWFGEENEAEVIEQLTVLAIQHPQKQLQSVYPTRFNSRLWTFLLQECQLKPEMRWAELGKKSFNRMAARLTNHLMTITAKYKWKEEFVTCGGIALSAINPSTLESKQLPGLFFAGEILDVDAITGGFNLQAAWTMAHMASKSMYEKTENSTQN